MVARLTGHEFRRTMESAENPAEGCRRILQTVRYGLEQKKFKPDDVSLMGLGLAIGAIDPYDVPGSIRRTMRKAFNSEDVHPESMLSESNPGLLSNAFQLLTGELVNFAVIDGYNTAEGLIGDELVTKMTVPIRNSRVPGVTTLGGPDEVAEGHPYTETTFGEKHVVTKESKKGRILSISQETIQFDQTGLIMMNARKIGELTRQERERVIVRGVQDADGAANYVYRPSGTGTALYVAGHKNYIGTGGVTGYDAAVALQDWTDVNHVFVYRSTQVTDDRLDGTPRPIPGLNNGSNILLVPEGLRATADYIKTATRQQKNTNSAADETEFGNLVAGRIGKVLSSPFVDEVNAADWYYGDFKGQFVWTEIWPIQTFTQGAGSEADFERDVGFRIKVRYYGGISAVETIKVTKTKGG